MKSISFLLVVFLAWVVYKFQPSLTFKQFDALDQEFGLPETRTIVSPDFPVVEFFGTSTLLFQDGQNAVMTDAFFSRTGLLYTLTRKLAPQKEMIKMALTNGRVPKKVDAIITCHSHYDHAIDAPEVAKQLNSVVIGSNSTANICLGQGLPKDKIKIVDNHVKGKEFEFGNYIVKLYSSTHTPRPISPYDIKEPLQQPARLLEYALGGVYNVHIAHKPTGKTYLVVASTGFIAGALKNVRADVVFLGVATLGKLSPEFQDEIWKENVLSVKAKIVIPIHYDDFFKPLDSSGSFATIPAVADDFPLTWAWLLNRSRKDNIQLRLLRAYRRVEL